MTTPAIPPPSMPPGWYLDSAAGLNRWWDGTAWTTHTAPSPPVYTQPTYALPVQPNVHQAMDRSQYVRPQTGHSLIKHLFLGIFVLYIPTIYYAVSPNHYFHA